MKFSKKNTRALRGQAFDTMMLVISVIIAIAILGVLMNILGGIKIGVNDPSSVMKTDLKSIVSSGYGISTPKKVSFDSGVAILPGSVIGDSPLQPGDIKFTTHSGDFDTSVMEINDDSIKVNKNSQGYVVVCGNDNPGRSGNPKYCISIARQANDARDTCVQKCNLR
ncbi:hypothetical protein HY994_03585 [Candidatus Micrarchaeota archaeon]|nr:hypothetical protein [Candidatus Micrarchaeota archaeon]